MGRQIFTEVDIPALSEAVAARGYSLVPLASDGCTSASDATFAAAILRRWGPGIELRTTAIPEIAVASCAATIAAALDAGAADAVAMPIDAAELAARVDARIRHHMPRPIMISDLHIDWARRIAMRGGIPLDLLPREFELLHYLAERRGRCVSRRDLLADIWGLNFDPGTNVVAVHMSKLRARIDRPFPSSLLHTVKGVGYRLETR